jgi:cytochrome c5
MERGSQKKSEWLGLVLIVIFTLGLISFSPRITLASNPTITLTANKNNYVIGTDHFTLKFNIKSGTENNIVDIYIVAQFPDNSFYFLDPQLQWTEQIVPVVTSWNVSDASGTLFEFQVPDIPTGTYAFWAVFTQPGSTAWPFISYSTASFKLIKPFKSPSTIMAAHNPNSATYNSDCISCHGDRVSEASLDPSIKPAHAMMLPFYPGGTVTNETCQACHSKGVDLRDESATSLWRNTDVTKCVACHSQAGPGKQFYQ